jgi:glucosyl-dolichyl phosphate glucuronosyltransferase
VRVTITICTWNRCELLRQTLEQVTHLLIPSDLEYEILVVDNNCTDNTSSVLASFADRLPLRVVHELQPGLSHARNRALLEARGDYILWTDDDVLVEETWLAAFVAGARQFPEAAAFGGTIVPWFTAEPDPDLSAAFPFLRRGFCGLERTMPAGILLDGEYVWGANMALRRRAAEGMTFDMSIGIAPDFLGGGEELVFIRQLRRGGGIVIWLPNMRVKHYVMPSRTTLEYLKSFSLAKGREEVLTQPPSDGKVPMIMGLPRWLLREWLTTRLRYWLSKIGWQTSPRQLRSGPPANASSSRRARSLTWLRECLFLWGMITEYRSSRRRAARSIAQP